MSRSDNDEFDLIAMLLDIWRSRFEVLAILTVSLLFSLTYIFFAPTVYLVSSNASVNIYNPIFTQNCTPETVSAPIRGDNCIDRMSFLALSRLIDSDWQVSSDGEVSMITQLPSSQVDYVSELNGVVQRANQDLLKSAQLELQVLQNLDDPNTVRTEIFARQQLFAVRAINLINHGENAFLISQPVIKKISPRTNLVIFGSLVGGFFLAIAFVAARSAMEKRS